MGLFTSILGAIGPSIIGGIFGSNQQKQQNDNSMAIHNSQMQWNNKWFNQTQAMSQQQFDQQMRYLKGQKNQYQELDDISGGKFSDYLKNQSFASPEEQGKMTRANLEAAFPELNPWELSGSNTAGAAGAMGVNANMAAQDAAGAENQRKMAMAQQQTEMSKLKVQSQTELAKAQMAANAQIQTARINAGASLGSTRISAAQNALSAGGTAITQGQTSRDVAEIGAGATTSAAETSAEASKYAAETNFKGTVLTNATSSDIVNRQLAVARERLAQEAPAIEAEIAKKYSDVQLNKANIGRVVQDTINLSLESSGIVLNNRQKALLNERTLKEIQRMDGTQSNLGKMIKDVQEVIYDTTSNPETLLNHGKVWIKDNIKPFRDFEFIKEKYDKYIKPMFNGVEGATQAPAQRYDKYRKY